MYTPPLGGMGSEHIKLQLLPIPSFPALLCEDTTYSWNTGYRCNKTGAVTRTRIRHTRTLNESPGVPGEPLGVPRESPESPRGVPGGPKEAPGSPRGDPKEAPRTALGTPRCTTGVPETAPGTPRSTKSATRPPLKTPESPDAWYLQYFQRVPKGTPSVT